jgi:hypothetical protein
MPPVWLPKHTQISQKEIHVRRDESLDKVMHSLDLNVQKDDQEEGHHLLLNQKQKSPSVIFLHVSSCKVRFRERHLIP